MNHATIPIIDHETCEDNYRNETGHSNDTSWSLHESFVCAGCMHLPQCISKNSYKINSSLRLSN